jgi:fibronectin type 3 domain-containing protein
VKQDVSNHIYNYVVRCQNTSYQLGPVSPKISAMIYGTQRLPMPIKLELIKVSENRVKLIWQNQRDAKVSGHIVYRKEVDSNEKEIKAFERIGQATVNQWSDSTLLSGKNYVYGVKNYGFDENDLSNISPTVSFTSTPDRIPGIEQLQAAYADGAVQLRWNNPLNVKLSRIEVYRAQEGTTPSKIADVNSSVSLFTDSKTKRGQTYYYFLKVVDAAGGESLLEGPAGIVVD